MAVPAGTMPGSAAYSVVSLLHGRAVELACGALPEARPAGRDQVHLYPHQRTPVQVFQHGPGRLDDLALCLMSCNARGGRVSAIVRWMAARPAQSSEPRAEPVTDTDVDERGVISAAESVDALFPRDQPMLRRGIQMLPWRPRKAMPVWALRIAVVLLSHHLTSFPGAPPVQQGLLNLSRGGRPLMAADGAAEASLRSGRRSRQGRLVVPVGFVVPGHHDCLFIDCRLDARQALRAARTGGVEQGACDALPLPGFEFADRGVEIGQELTASVDLDHLGGGQLLVGPVLD